MLSLLLITTGCRTTKQELKISLPPKPQRQELTRPESLKDYAQILNYYEHLVQEWEQWSDTVTALVDEDLTKTKK